MLKNKVHFRSPDRYPTLTAGFGILHALPIVRVSQSLPDLSQLVWDVQRPFPAAQPWEMSYPQKIKSADGVLARMWSARGRRKGCEPKGQHQPSLALVQPSSARLLTPRLRRHVAKVPLTVEVGMEG